MEYFHWITRIENDPHAELGRAFARTPALDWVLPVERVPHILPPRFADISRQLVDGFVVQDGLRRET